MVFFCVVSQAQIVKAYVAGGFNLSQVDGDQAYGYKKFGPNIGVGVDFNVLPFMSFSIEANFNQKGAYQKANYPDSIRTGAYKLNINYAEIPILINFSDKTFRLGVGVSYGRMVNNAREECFRTDHSNYIVYNKTDEMMTFAEYMLTSSDNKGYANIVKEWNDKHGKINPNDFNIIAALEARIWESLKFEFRFAYSLKSLRTSDYYRQFDGDIPEGIETYFDGTYTVFKRKEYNNTLTFRLIYVINEKQVEKNKALIRSRKGELR